MEDQEIKVVDEEGTVQFLFDIDCDDMRLGVVPNLDPLVHPRSYYQVVLHVETQRQDLVVMVGGLLVLYIPELALAISLEDLEDALWEGHEDVVLVTYMAADILAATEALEAGGLAALEGDDLHQVLLAHGD